jgi:hypothetical protein
MFSNYVLVHVVASLYATLIKLADPFDGHMDVIEMGMYWR